jgi:hypothetical protein
MHDCLRSACPSARDRCTIVCGQRALSRGIDARLSAISVPFRAGSMHDCLRSACPSARDRCTIVCGQRALFRRHIQERTGMTPTTEFERNISSKPLTSQGPITRSSAPVRARILARTTPSRSPQERGGVKIFRHIPQEECTDIVINI